MKNKVLNILYICIITTISTLATYAQGVYEEYEIKADIPVRITNRTNNNLRFNISAYNVESGKILQDNFTIVQGDYDSISIPYDTELIMIDSNKVDDSYNRWSFEDEEE